MYNIKMSELQQLSTVTTRSGKELYICRGYDDNIVEQLAKKSQEEEILRRCPKDAATRFGSPEAFQRWVTKGLGGRVLYPVVDADGDLDITVWYGVEELGTDTYPKADPLKLMLGKLMTDTFAIRAYESSMVIDEDGTRHGSGVAKQVLRETLGDYARLRTTGEQGDKPTFTGIHLETDIDNLPARRTYEDFWPIAENLNRNRIAMVLPLPRIGEVLGLDLAA